MIRNCYYAPGLTARPNTLKNRLSLCQIAERIAEFNSITLTRMIVGGRNREIVTARKQYAYFAKKETKHSLKEIGQVIGKDHATIIYYVREIKSSADVYLEDRVALEEINKLLYSDDQSR